MRIGDLEVVDFPAFIASLIKYQRGAGRTPRYVIMSEDAHLEFVEQTQGGLGRAGCGFIQEEFMNLPIVVLGHGVRQHVGLGYRP